MSETTTEPAVDTETELEPDEALEPSHIDTEAELEPEPDTEPADAAADAGQSTQALLRALESEHGRHQRAVAKALGIETEEMHECPMCEGVGWTPEAIGAPPPLVQDPYTETCPRCQGNGETLSGATARGLYSIPCNGCGGSGYVTKQEQPDAGAQFGSGAPPTPAYVPPALPSAADEAELAAFRARGYTIIEPIVVPAAVSS